MMQFIWIALCVAGGIPALILIVLCVDEVVKTHSYD